MALAGLDIGTTGCKISVYDNEGNYKFGSYCDYPVIRRTKEHQVRAEAIWEGVKKVLGDAGRNCPDLEAIGVSSFGECCVFLDEKDQPVRSCMLYTDPRGTQECRDLTQALGKEKIQKITGVNPHSMYSMPKLMWIMKNRPEDYKKTKRILMMEEFVIYMLTGNRALDYSLAARTMAFDIEQLTWSREIFQAAGVDQELFTKPVLSGTYAGTVRKSLAQELGISEKTVVVPAGHDQVTAAMGSGVFDADCAVDGAGTVECITPVFDGIPQGKELYEGNYGVIPYVIPGKYVTYAFSFTGGALVAWYIDNLAKWEKSLAREQGRSVYELLEEGMQEEPTGILVLPHFAGAGTPYMDEGSMGAIVGLNVEHTASDLYRAMMEGVAYEMMVNLEWLARAGIAPKKLRATGGGAASKVWMQMKADILNLPIVSLGNSEAGAVGCAMAAGKTVGRFKDLKEAASVFLQEKDVYEPRGASHRAYMEHYEKYRELYRAVRPLV